MLVAMTRTQPTFVSRHFLFIREKTLRPERTCIARQNLLYYQENFIFICSKLFSFMYRMTHNHSFLKQQYSITNFKKCSYIFVTEDSTLIVFIGFGILQKVVTGNAICAISSCFSIHFLLYILKTG
jgi:hypothetical protein